MKKQNLWPVFRRKMWSITKDLKMTQVLEIDKDFKRAIYKYV